MKIHKGILPLLLDSGVFTPEDVNELNSVTIAVILDMMVKKEALAESQIDAASALLEILDNGGSKSQIVRAKSKFMDLVVNKLHKRIRKVRAVAAERRKQATAGIWPLVAVVKDIEK